MTSIFQRLLPSGKVFAIRVHKKRPHKTGSFTSHPSPPTTDPPNSRLSEAADVIELVSPMVQAVAGVIPVAGAPLQAVVGGLLSIIQMIDTTKRNKADLDDLATRLHRLLEFLSLEPHPRDKVEAARRTALARCLKKTSDKLKKMQERPSFTFAYKSVTQDIAECNTNIDRFLLEYGLYEQAFIKRQLGQLLVSPRDCAILIDAVGHEHKVPLEYCASFQQLKDMLSVLIPLEQSGGSVQRRYITSGKFDFCIDDGKRVTVLTSNSNVWQNIETGTRIVMRVVFERLASYSATYECHLCGASNKLVSFSSLSGLGWLTNGSLDCHACKGRFQISVDRGRKNQGGNDRIDTETRHCIRNFRVTQTEPDRVFFRPKSRPFRSSFFPPLPFLRFLRRASQMSNSVATTSSHGPNGGFANFYSHFENSAPNRALLESGPIARPLATSPGIFYDDTSDDEIFEECDDGLGEVEPT